MRARRSLAITMTAYLITGVVSTLLAGGLILGGQYDEMSARLAGDGPTGSGTTPLVGTVAPAADEVLPLPGNPHDPDRGTLLRTSAPPLISRQEALHLIHNGGAPWALGGQYEGETVTIRAEYGLVTLGRPGEHGRDWLGDRNIPLPTGEVLDHIERRPMWIVDYGNVIAYGSGCPRCPPPIFNHIVYAVDAQTRAVLLSWFYKDDTFAVPTAVAIPEEPLARAGRIWAQVRDGTMQTLTPILKPTSLPPGFETVQLLSAGRGQFAVEYRGPGRFLQVEAGGYDLPEHDPPYFGADDVLQRVTVRGQPGALHINRAAGATQVSLLWAEPAQWLQWGSRPRDRVAYQITAEGLSPEEVLRAAEALTT